MKGKRVIITVLTVFLSFAGAVASAEESIWMDNFQQARKLATERKVPILAYFSGSDWCGWCKRLDSEVLSTDVFRDFAQENFVLFLADFPSRKKLEPSVAAQNDELQQKYKIEGFPTLLLLTADGKVVAQTGYRRGGPGKYVRHLKGLKP